MNQFQFHLKMASLPKFLSSRLLLKHAGLNLESFTSKWPVIKFLLLFSFTLQKSELRWSDWKKQNKQKKQQQAQKNKQPVL